MTLPPACRAVRRCLACGSAALQLILDLGWQPLANRFVHPRDAGQNEPIFPLGIQHCRDCLLVQLTHVVDPSLLFTTYVYVPSTSTTWLAHCEELADDVVGRARLRPGDLVVEVGSNDGTLLRAFQRRGQRVLGVDPAANIAAQADAAGVPTLNRFFGEAVAREVLERCGPARAVVSTNVLAHVPDPVGFLRGVGVILASDGLYVNESPSLHEMVRHNEFDTIYHEHVSYFSLHALLGLFGRAGLHLRAATPRPVHGGTLRVFGCTGKEAAARGVRAPALADLLAAERQSGLADGTALSAFSARAERVREQLTRLVQAVRAEGRRVAAYGATAKGNTLLGYCGLTAAQVEAIADRNPRKQGLLAPGSRIPIVSPDWLRARPPDVLLLLAWNLADEIRQQLAWFGDAGGQFLLPVPEPRLV